MSDSEPTTHLSDLAQWLDAIKLALNETALLNVRYAESPGALVAQVAPDPAGITTSIELIRLAQPTVALLVSPVPWADDDDMMYTLFLHGEDRVTIRCAPAPPLDPPDFLARYGSSSRIPEDEWRRITEGLLEQIQRIVEIDPTWHPRTARHGNNSRIIDAYLEEHPSEDPETVATVATSAEVDRALADAQKKQVAAHRLEWARNSDAMARGLLTGPDGKVLRTNKEAREQVVAAYLRELDSDCATGASTRAIVSAISRAVRSDFGRPPPAKGLVVK